MGVALTLFSVVPAVTSHIIPRWAYWLAAFFCFVITAYKMWSEQYDRAEMHKREADEMYSDVILDWFKNTSSTPAFFPSALVAEEMKLDHEKVLRGLEVLEKTLKVVRNDGAQGWFYNPIAAMRFDCGMRRLVPVRTIDAGSFSAPIVPR
jgi:hypothetical protein